MEDKKRPWALCLRTTAEIVLAVCGTDKCIFCDHDVWVSPATVDAIKKDNAKVFCLECFNEDKGPPKAKAKFTMTKEQLEEFAMLRTSNEA